MPRLVTKPPTGSIKRGPNLSINTPLKGVRMVETINPMENVAAMVPLDQPNSSRIGGNKSENDVRALTEIAIDMKAMPMMTQP
jgi:hypothetical protein